MQKRTACGKLPESRPAPERFQRQPAVNDELRTAGEVFWCHTPCHLLTSADRETSFHRVIATLSPRLQRRCQYWKNQEHDDVELEKCALPRVRSAQKWCRHEMLRFSQSDFTHRAANLNCLRVDRDCSRIEQPDNFIGRMRAALRAVAAIQSSARRSLDHPKTGTTRRSSLKSRYSWFGTGSDKSSVGPDKSLRKQPTSGPIEQGQYFTAESHSQSYGGPRQASAVQLFRQDKNAPASKSRPERRARTYRHSSGFSCLSSSLD